MQGGDGGGGGDGDGRVGVGERFVGMDSFITKKSKRRRRTSKNSRGLG